MGWFIFAIILAVIAIGVGTLGRLGVEDKKDRWMPTALGAAVFIVAFLLYVVGGLKSVPVKNIGVPTSFGKVGSSVYQPGIHETWTPWLHLTDIDETVQTISFEDKGNDNGTSCTGGLPVRIGGQQTACADVTLQYQIKPGAAGSLFSDYANTGNFMSEIANAVVLKEFKQVVNGVLGDYNPITDVQSVTNSGTQTSQFTTFGPTILADMQKDIGSEITVRTVYLPQLHYSSTIESELAKIQTAYADDAVANENIKVNEANATALEKLGTPSLNELVAQCLNDVKSESSLPAGFSCFGSNSSLALSGK